MRTKIRTIQKRRSYSEEFKKELVLLFESGKYSVKQLTALYGIQGQVIYRWLYKYSRYNDKNCRIIEMKQSDTDKLKQMESRIKELERMVGQKQIKIEYLEKMIELTEEELHIDIKKNADTPQSSGSERTKKK